ncbi:MAG TPA: Gfo/Idh/MocA family oxidoreductase [Bryobacteraceae bacterium]|jgi:predicted dehydrogenase|nr:Gfo/Idh/MocA family oxidoreductase [Bryobacteraceae bacterium]
MNEPAAVAIVGCGLIGQKRAQALNGCRVRVCCDAVLERAQKLAARYPGAEAVADWFAAATHPAVDIVIVAVTHDQLATVAEAAAAAGKHVLIEKPGARRAAELDPVLRAAERSGAVVRVGFNHRYHRALQEARRIFLSGALGEMMFVRGRYGHGGRIGYDREWRADPKISGGGELLDQGIHLIDLSRWFLGEFASVQAHIATYFWDMPVEDNAFLILTTGGGQTAFLHATWTEWKNLFSLEIYGRVGKLEISGLGGSYGVERLAHYRMSPEMGPPETTIWEYPTADRSWDLEFSEFLEDIRQHREPEPGIRDAQAALRVIEQVYRNRAPKSA